MTTSTQSVTDWSDDCAQVAKEQLKDLLSTQLEVIAFASNMYTQHTAVALEPVWAKLVDAPIVDTNPRT